MTCAWLEFIRIFSPLPSKQGSSSCIKLSSIAIRAPDASRVLKEFEIWMLAYRQVLIGIR